MEMLVCIALISIALSGLPGLLCRKGSDSGQMIAHALHTTGSIAGVAVACAVLLSGKDVSFAVGTLGGLPALFVLDPLAAVFILPVLVVANFASWFGLDYWRQSDGSPHAAMLRVWFGLVTAGLSSVTLAGDVLSFLIAWEVMALSAFFLIITENDKQEVRSAGWVYFVTTHISTLLLFGFFGLAWSVSGSHIFSAFAGVQHGHLMANTLFLLALCAFGIKAGVFPGHFWLPPAHACAPSHVSAILSGVLLKVGIYGLLRVTFLLKGEMAPWWGVLILTLGGISAVLGVALALGQHDLKRLLAYHSIENIGIILLGVGVAFLGVSHGSPWMIVLGLTGAILHVWNHALFKSLLFLAAGTVVHATGTREIDALGGLSKVMPRTSLFFLLGAVAICGLPPLNGFVSEIVIYLGLLRGFSEHSSFLAAGGCLALVGVGGLALACFTKAFGAVFLGSGRSNHASRGHEASRWMQVAMAGLAAGCIFIALAPLTAIRLVRGAVVPWLPGGVSDFTALTPPVALEALAIVNPAVSLAFLALCLLVLRRYKVGTNLTWDCGYAAPAPSMQYTGSSFAQFLVSQLAGLLLPRTKQPQIIGPFPIRAAFHSAVPDPVLERALAPSYRFLQMCTARLRILQSGNTQMYVLYVLVTTVLVLVFAI